MSKRNLFLKDFFKVTKVKRNSQAKMLENTEAGHILKFIIQLKTAGSNRGQTYATYIQIINLDTGEQTSKSFNQLFNIFRTVDLVEINLEDVYDIIEEGIISEGDLIFHNNRGYEYVDNEHMLLGRRIHEESQVLRKN